MLRWPVTAVRLSLERNAKVIHAVAVPEPLPPSLLEERRHRIPPELAGPIAHDGKRHLRSEDAHLLLRCSVIEIHSTPFS